MYLLLMVFFARVIVVVVVEGEFDIFVDISLPFVVDKARTINIVDKHYLLQLGYHVDTLVKVDIAGQKESMEVVNQRFDLTNCTDSGLHDIDWYLFDQYFYFGH